MGNSFLGGCPSRDKQCRRPSHHLRCRTRNLRQNGVNAPKYIKQNGKSHRGTLSHLFGAGLEGSHVDERLRHRLYDRCHTAKDRETGQSYVHALQRRQKKQGTRQTQKCGRGRGRDASGKMANAGANKQSQSTGDDSLRRQYERDGNKNKPPTIKRYRCSPDHTITIFGGP